MDQISSYCSIHKNLQNQFVNLSNQDVNQLQCSTCVLRNQSKDTYIPITEVMINNEQIPITNWPLGIDQKTIDFLTEQSATNKKQQIKEKLQQFYKDIQVNTLKIIEDSQALMINFLDNTLFEQNDLMKFYNEKFKRQQLKDLLINQKEFSKSKFKQLLNEVEQNKKYYLDLLNGTMLEIQNIEEIIAFNQSNHIKETISNILSQIPQLSKEYEKINKLKQNIKVEKQINLKSKPFKFELIKQELDNNKKFQVKQDENQNWLITNNSSLTKGFVVSNQIFETNKTYILRFKLNLPLYKCDSIWFGISANDLRNDYAILKSNSSGAKHDIIKGYLFQHAKNKDEIFEIEIRIRLDKGKMQFLDYPNYQNILQSKQISKDQNYRLTIFFGGDKNKEVTISYSRVYEDKDCLPFYI